jgi:membrane protein implicated in regulation of membrane protease activity
MVWTLWWVWAGAALVLGILEVLLPGFILLGFAGGAAVVAILMAIGGPIAAMLTGSWQLTALVFALGSLVTWLVVRRVIGVQRGQVKLWDKDINDN